MELAKGVKEPARINTVILETKKDTLKELRDAAYDAEISDMKRAGFNTNTNAFSYKKKLPAGQIRKR